MRVAFQQSKMGLESFEVDSFEGLNWGSRDRLTTAKVRRLLATMVVPKGEGAVTYGFWKFKVAGDVEQFSHMGGMLSVTDGSVNKEFCNNCDLKRCGSSTNVDCEFSVHIEGNAKYIIALFGVSDEEPEHPTISLLYKPPRGCKQVIDCNEPDDPCTRVPLQNMPWFAMKGERMPWFECKMSFAANLLKMEVDVKPFCASPELFPDVRKNHGAGATLQQQCWPKETMPGAEGCSGSYPITDIVKENRGVLLASERATQTSPDYQVSIASNGECSMTAASGFSGTTENIVSYLRFEEGPCDMDFDKDTERENIVLDRSKPEHKMACSSRTFGTHGVDATIYAYAIKGDTMSSNENVVASKQIKPDATGTAMRSPGHSGNFYMEFANEKVVNNSGNITTITDGYLVSQDLPGENAADLSNSATLSAWIAHPGRNVNEDGETLWSFIPKAVLSTGVKQPARQYIDIAIMPFGRLRFRSVFTTPTTHVDHATQNEYTLYTELRCELQSPPQPALLNGHWHHVAVIIDADDFEVVFFADGSYVTKKL
jgi:hypothetical protein